MAILSALSSFALRQVMGEGAEGLIGTLNNRLSDQSQLLTRALQQAGERAWKAVEVALAGESLWNKLDAADDKAFRRQVRELVDALPLTGQGGKEEFRRQC